MARHRTLKLDEAEKALIQIAGLDPIIVDEKLVAVKVGGLRIASSKGEQLTVFECDGHD